MHTEGHDPGRPEGTSPHPSPVRDSENPGYELTDINVSGILVFLSGLVGFLLVFFVFCFFLGKVINGQLLKEYGPPTKWNHRSAFEGAADNNGKRENLSSTTEMEQKELQQVTSTFPAPRLETDDGAQDTADLHAREDLLLNHYSTVEGESGTVRIPIERAMELVAQRGLPVAPAASQMATSMTGDGSVAVQVPLTTGFSRTGYEQQTIETRAQKLEFEHAEGASHEAK